MTANEGVIVRQTCATSLESLGVSLCLKLILDMTIDKPHIAAEDEEIMGNFLLSGRTLS